MISISESGVTFGPYSPRLVYQNEKSTNLAQHVKAVEFTLVNHNGTKLVFVEAKSSFSNPQNTGDFEKNITEISEKFIDSLSTLVAAKLERKQAI